MNCFLTRVTGDNRFSQNDIQNRTTACTLTGYFVRFSKGSSTHSSQSLTNFLVLTASRWSGALAWKKMRNKIRKRTKAAVFLLESNTLSDEKSGDAEGEILSKILHLSRVETKYFYFRTKRELKMLLKEFQDSSFRYLHIACHGDSDGMATTFDDLSFSELSGLIVPFINRRRVFLSACAMTNT